MDGDAELRLAIMSSIAQEESRRTSERVKWGQKRRMEQGVVFGRSMLGYRVRDGACISRRKEPGSCGLSFRNMLRREGNACDRTGAWGSRDIAHVRRGMAEFGDPAHPSE